LYCLGGVPASAIGKFDAEKGEYPFTVSFYHRIKEHYGIGQGIFEDDSAPDAVS